jgi:hypothetical protein
MVVSLGLAAQRLRPELVSTDHRPSTIDGGLSTMGHHV